MKTHVQYEFINLGTPEMHWMQSKCLFLEPPRLLNANISVYELIHMHV